METFIDIGRNSIFVLLGLTVFAAICVAVATWFAKNTNEPQPH